MVNDYVLDWSMDFDRESKSVPSTERWEEYKKELTALKNKILNSSPSRNILIQGRITLSTSILVGSIFPLNGGWNISFFQPQMNAEWFTNVSLIENYKLESKNKPISDDGESLVAILDITGRGAKEVEKFVSESKFSTKEIIEILPQAGTGSQSIKNNEDAISFAHYSVEKLRSRAKELGVNNISLFYYGPASLALFIGQRLTSLGTISCFEYQDPSYVRSITFKT